MLLSFLNIFFHTNDEFLIVIHLKYFCYFKERETCNVAMQWRLCMEDEGNFKNVCVRAYG